MTDRQTHSLPPPHLRTNLRHEVFLRLAVLQGHELYNVAFCTLLVFTLEPVAVAI
jgi:hypothetical protein